MSEDITLSVIQQIKKGAAIIKKGGIVAFPTDTVYGLGASIFNEKAVSRIFEVKQRPQNMALPVLISDIAMLNNIVNNLPGVALKLAEHFWPGALTMVLLKSDRVPGVVTAGENTIAVRLPAHPVPLTLIAELGIPIVGTSANLSGKPSPVNAKEVKQQLGDKVDLIIDGGTSPGGQESTIIDLTAGKPVILREGPISLEAIQNLLKVV